MRNKVFTYVTIRVNEVFYLLVFKSINEPGFEIPKGTVETGEKLETAVRREVFEESGFNKLQILKELGNVIWKDEEHHFFLAEVESSGLNGFTHLVTGNDIDEGFSYEYSWEEITQDLKNRLVQGSERFFDALIFEIGTF